MRCSWPAGWVTSKSEEKNNPWWWRARLHRLPPKRVEKLLQQALSRKAVRAHCSVVKVPRSAHSGEVGGSLQPVWRTRATHTHECMRVGARVCGSACEQRIAALGMAGGELTEHRERLAERRPAGWSASQLPAANQRAASFTTRRYKKENLLAAAAGRLPPLSAARKFEVSKFWKQGH